MRKARGTATRTRRGRSASRPPAPRRHAQGASSQTSALLTAASVATAGTTTTATRRGTASPWRSVPPNRLQRSSMKQDAGSGIPTECRR
ncbi:hypothetical protein V5799_027260 [Amblyomma americanum]|uniref:Uncharacterized protein n=1 Tax=Amblyomma americanum TaxID=6943 RepID=A0AAQ4DG83_AMBAM